ncbi:MAG: SsrA-binding protein SmpB [Bacteroidetes bacterium]|nr:SsrA-binding protein SmpB [Bacteroidota bacterium]
MTEKKAPPIVDNRRARHEYSIIETFEAGIVLQGTEVKSLRAGRANLSDAYARILSGEVFILGMHISPYEQGSYNNHDPLRNRKLLLNSREIMKLRSRIEREGYTLVPLKVYFNERGRVKVDLAVCKGKQLHDKRESIRERESKRELDRMKKHKTG